MTPVFSSPKGLSMIFKKTLTVLQGMIGYLIILYHYRAGGGSANFMNNMSVSEEEK